MLGRKLSIAHVLPGMNFGGVEIGILKSYKVLNQEFDYKVYYVRESGTLDVAQSSVLILLKNILFKKNYPDLLLTSLWWGHLVGILLLPFGIRWACFIHSTGYSSLIDKITIKLALTFSKNHIFDSTTTKEYFNSFKNRNNFVVPYIFSNPGNEFSLSNNPQYTFSWVGRNSKEKRLDLLVKFIASLEKEGISFRFNVCIAGDRYSPLDNLAAKLNNSISLQYNVLPEKVISIYKDSKISLCFSDYEGFSATIAEAALHGNLICGRKVGELPNYLCNEQTIWLDDLSPCSWEAFIFKVKHCLDDESNLVGRRHKSQSYTKKVFGSSSYTSSLSTCLYDILNN
jgi:glycosyltransferase involved in cell wall biosynthesis